MSDAKPDLAAEDILTALYKLASVGASNALNINLAALEKDSSVKLGLEALIMLAMAGCETDDERAFTKACWSAL